MDETLLQVLTSQLTNAIESEEHGCLLGSCIFPRRKGALRTKSMVLSRDQVTT